MLKRLIIFAVLIALGFALFAIVDPLSYYKKLDTDVYVIEGWLSKTELEYFVENYNQDSITKLIICGMSYPEGYIKTKPFIENHKASLTPFPSGIKDVRMITNGAAVIWFNNALNSESLSEITINAKGGINRGIYTHINVILNDSLVKDFFVPDSLTSLSFSTDMKIIHSMVIDFDNDSRCSRQHDRNIAISDILINGISVNKLNTDTYVTSSYNTESYPRGVASQAEATKNYLIQLGMDASKIVVVSSPYTEINKTLANSLALGKYINANGKDFKKINIITTEKHSHRSYVNYKNTVKNAKVGIIPISETDVTCEDRKTKNNELLIVDEKISLAITRLYWLFH